MNYNTINNKKLGETIFEYNHKSGLKVFFVKKAGYNKKTAMFGTNYGSMDNIFKVAESDEEIHVPDGIAHFLEHKLFEQKDGNMLEKFSKLGSSPNAFTSFNQTVYYFSCTDLFEENFRMLLDYVQNPWLTDENVEKEKGIIGQEIRMYQDNAGWRVFFNLLECLYINNPVKLEISGTIDSISKINKELLYQCYNTFYTPSNMVVTVAGDCEPETIFAIVDEMIKFVDKGKVEKKYPVEPNEISKGYIQQKLAVSMPLFNMGIKDNVLVTGYDLVKRRTALNIATQYAAGRSSRLFNDLYSQGLINESFSSEASINANYSYLAWGGQSVDPKKTCETISTYIKKMAEEGMGKDAFDRIKKSQKGAFIRSLNSMDSITRVIMDSYFNNSSFFDIARAYEELDIDYMNEVIKEVFNNPWALSVINPQ